MSKILDKALEAVTAMSQETGKLRLEQLVTLAASTTALRIKGFYRNGNDEYLARVHFASDYRSTFFDIPASLLRPIPINTIH